MGIFLFYILGIIISAISIELCCWRYFKRIMFWLIITIIMVIISFFKSDESNIMQTHEGIVKKIEIDELETRLEELENKTEKMEIHNFEKEKDSIRKEIKELRSDIIFIKDSIGIRNEIKERGLAFISGVIVPIALAFKDDFFESAMHIKKKTRKKLRNSKK